VSTASRCVSVLSNAVAVPACSPAPELPQAPTVPPADAGRASNLSPQRIQIGDGLASGLLLNPARTAEVTVPADGGISAAIVSDQLACGRTVPHSDAALEREHPSLLRNPHGNMVVQSFAPTRAHMGGQHRGFFYVANPGATTVILSGAVAASQ
jgi:hypothetical protein